MTEELVAVVSNPKCTSSARHSRSGSSSASGATPLSYCSGSSILRQAVTTAGSGVVRSETRVVDLAGRITGVHTSAGGTTPVTLAAVGYTMDELGRRTVARREDGSTWDYGYNDRSEVTSGSKKLPNAALAAGQQFAYAYDGIGNRTSAPTDPQGTYPRQTSYTANALNQYASITYPRSLDVLVRTPATNLTVASGTNDVGIDDQGTYNRAEVTTTASTAQWMPVDVTAGGGTLSEGHLWLPPASVSPTHDADGNLIHDGRWDYVWDGENRLVSMRPTTAAVTAGAPNIGLDFRYDHRSRRIAKKVIDLGNNNAVLSDLRFCYDGWNLAAEFSAGSNNTLTLLRSCTWGPDLSNTLRGAGGVGGLLAVRVGEADYYPCFDGNGNIIAWSDAAGAVRRRVDYDPFGNVTAVENTATGMPAIPFGFSTKYTDEETGLLYYGHRYYLPPWGRWGSQDPIQEEGGVNLYGFVGNDGSNYFDAFGLEEYVLIVDAIDPMFTDWATYTKSVLEHGGKTAYNNKPHFDPAKDTIITIKPTSLQDIEKEMIKCTRVAYIASFGHGKVGVFYYNRLGLGSIGYSTGKQSSDPTTILVPPSRFPRAKYADGAFMELYHCRCRQDTDFGESVAADLQKSAGIPVYGTPTGISNGYPWNRGYPRFAPPDAPGQLPDKNPDIPGHRNTDYPVPVAPSPQVISPKQTP